MVARPLARPLARARSALSYPLLAVALDHDRAQRG